MWPVIAIVSGITVLAIYCAIRVGAESEKRANGERLQELAERDKRNRELAEKLRRASRS